MIHCGDCSVEVGDASRADFEDCPHGDDDCDAESPCPNCRLMADVPPAF